MSRDDPWTKKGGAGTVTLFCAANTVYINLNPQIAYNTANGRFYSAINKHPFGFDYKFNSIDRNGVLWGTTQYGASSPSCSEFVSEGVGSMPSTFEGDSIKNLTPRRFRIRRHDFSRWVEGN